MNVAFKVFAGIVIQQSKTILTTIVTSPKSYYKASKGGYLLLKLLVVL